MDARPIENVWLILATWRSPPKITGSMILWIAAGFLVAAAAFILFVKLFARRMGCACGICGDRMLFFRELKPSDQDEIVSYFETYENRTPDTNRVLACPDCRIVYDEFSGEWRSLEGDEYFYCKICSGVVMPMSEYIRRGELSACLARNPGAEDLPVECFRCGRDPVSPEDCMVCDTPIRAYGCNHCRTLYVWTTPPKGTFRYFTPLNDEAILDRVREFMIWDM